MHRQYVKSNVDAQEKARGLAYIAQIEQTFQLRFEEGRNPGVQFMAHLWEPLRWLHKPLAVYMLAECMGLVTSCLLHALGFRVFRHHNVRTPFHIVFIAYVMLSWGVNIPGSSCVS